MIANDVIVNHQNWVATEVSMSINSAYKFFRALRISAVVLDTLNLHNCNLKDSGLAIVASYAKKTGSLMRLGLQQNFITDIGVDHLATALDVRLIKLEKLDLSFNFISGIGALRAQNVANQVNLSRNVISVHDKRILDLFSYDFGTQNMASLPQVSLTCQMVYEMTEQDNELSKSVIDEVYGTDTWDTFLSIGLSIYNISKVKK